jgi:hypothetical protein
MTMRSTLFGLGLSILMSVAGGAQTPPTVPGATEHHGGFGLPDQEGRRLLVIPKLTRPELLKTALCGNRRVPVQFDRGQREGANRDGRQTSRSFDSVAGSVFTVLGRDAVTPDTPCFLASDALMVPSVVLSIAVPAGSGACRQRGRFGTLRGRRVVHCWPLARLGSVAQVALVEFERRGTDALASLVLVDDFRTIFADVHAEFRTAGEDLWRVDDGGMLSPRGLTIVCALRQDGWYALGTAWAGTEGRSLSLWISEGNDRFTEVINDYWYQSPN